jgi:hypothetical protein
MAKDCNRRSTGFENRGQTFSLGDQPSNIHVFNCADCNNRRLQHFAYPWTTHKLVWLARRLLPEILRVF